MLMEVNGLRISKKKINKSAKSIDFNKIEQDLENTNNL